MTEDLWLEMEEMSRAEREAVPWRYRIVHFEVDASFDDHKLDLHPEYIHPIREDNVSCADEVLATLRGWRIEIESLGYPDSCDLP